jgi:hypothetical protein
LEFTGTILNSILLFCLWINFENTGNGNSSSKSKTGFSLEPPEKFSVFSPPETFDHMTLSDKIDGKAELYLPAGFKSLFAQRLKPQDSPDVWYEVFIYDMGTMLNAFSVYSAQRRDNARPEPFAEFAYSAENALFWVHGPYYIEIIASEVSDNTLDHLLRSCRIL